MAVPAAVMVVRGARWARIALIILAGLSLGSLYQAIDLQAWGSVVLNLILGSTLGMLTSRKARDYFATRRSNTAGE